MKFLNFLKKRKKKEISEPKKEISFSEIPSYLEEKEKNNQDEKERIFILISEEIKNFNGNVKERIISVKEFDLNSKKAEDKLKAITEVGRKKYLEAIEEFLDNINNLEKEDFKKFFEKIDRLLVNFNKSSNKNYERATVLIGKEMSDLRETLKNFSKRLAEIFKENKKIIEICEEIDAIKERVNEFEKNKKNCERIKENIEDLKKKISELEKEKENTEKEIEKIKESKEYLENQKRKEKIISLEKDIENKINELQREIDFKALASFFHIFENSMQIVKSHKENFQNEFEKDNGKRILELLEESKLNNSFIENKIKEIRNKKEELFDCKQNIKKEEIEDLFSKIKNIKEDISELKNEIEKKEKLREKLKENNLEIEEAIKSDLRNLN